ncbi:MAG: hypothetical protein QGG84_07470 [Rhodospirillales bacterium]|nr:hypothetical protein [Rhodospirillales bacterium]
MRPKGVNIQMYRFDNSDHDKVAEAVLATLPQCHGCYPDMIITANSIEMRNWFHEIQADFEAPYGTWLEVKESIDIIKVTVNQILQSFQRNDHEDVDTFLHVGGALGMVSMIDELKQKLGRPIVSSNAATYWYAMRQHGIKDTRDDLDKLETL